MRKRMSRRYFLERASKTLALAGVTGSSFLLKGCDSGKEYDIVIKDGWIIDGRGKKAFQRDVGISTNIIKNIGKIDISRGKLVIPAKNLAVCPGFIDVHEHTDVELLVNPKAESIIRQGVTTAISGNCGSSPFPVAEKTLEEEKMRLWENYQLELDWRNIQGFFSRLESRGLALNYSTLVGHGTIRGAAMGFEDRKPTEKELELMRNMVAENIKQGALGLSSGLEYAPGCFADKEELQELSRIVAQYRGVYATHMRDEGDKLLEALEEAIGVARSSGVSLQISHLKTVYVENWPKIDEVLSRVSQAKKEGINVFCDRYPYIAGASGLSLYFPLWAREGTTQDFLARLKNPEHDQKLREFVAEKEKKLGTWEKVVISYVLSDKNKIFEGKSVLEGAKIAQKPPYEFMRDLIIEEKNQVGMVIFSMSEENLRKILAHPLVGVGSDGSAVAPYGVLARGKPHPRLYGTFPRVLGKYVREEKILPLEEMIKRMTSVAAQKFGLKKRGCIERGYYADLVIFDPDRVIDRATWTEPHQYPQGIEWVIVNGQVVIKEGEHTGNLPGKILKKEV